MRFPLLFAAFAAAVLAGCISSDSQSRSSLPLGGEQSAPTPLPPTYAKILDSPGGPVKDNGTNEWRIATLPVRYRNLDYDYLNPLFDVYVERGDVQVFRRLGLPADKIARGEESAYDLDLNRTPIFMGYAGEYTIRIQMRPFRSSDVNYTDSKTYDLT
ncbi:MAG: hypothetical protein V1787_04350 [Candidatus Micrarchaeota archaeon]